MSWPSQPAIAPHGRPWLRRTRSRNTNTQQRQQPHSGHTREEPLACKVHPVRKGKQSMTPSRGVHSHQHVRKQPATGGAHNEGMGRHTRFKEGGGVKTFTQQQQRRRRRRPSIRVCQESDQCSTPSYTTASQTHVGRPAASRHSNNPWAFRVRRW